MKWGLAVLAVAVVASLVWGSCEARRATAAESSRDSALAVSAVLAAQDEALAAAAARDSARADSLGALADRHGARADSLTAILRRPKPPVPLPDSTAADSARYWRAIAEELQVDLWAASAALGEREAEVKDLRGQLDAQKAAAAKLRAAYEGERDRANGLEVALRKMPTGCAKVPLLGLPMPRFGPGGALTRHGIEPALAFVVPLGGC